jgi:hypothetical protein
MFARASIRRSQQAEVSRYKSRDFKSRCEPNLGNSTPLQQALRYNPPFGGEVVEIASVGGDISAGRAAVEANVFFTWCAMFFIPSRWIL